MRGKAKTRGKREARTVLFYLVVIILGIVLTGMTMLFLYKVNRRTYSYTTEPNTLLHMLNRGEYAQVWREVQNNRALGETKEKDKDYALPYAVTDYFEAASYYNAYLENGDAEKAGQYKAAMEEAYEDMGELQFLAEEIDEMFQKV